MEGDDDESALHVYLSVCMERLLKVGTQDMWVVCRFKILMFDELEKL